MLCAGIHQRLFRFGLAALACSGLAVLHAAGPGFEFEDVTAAAGTNQHHGSNDFITGQAWGDYDNDGWPDLYLTDGQGPNTLYRNLGNGTFAVSEYAPQVALSDRASGGVTFADYDNDGWLDLLVLNNGQDVLFRNTGAGFVDVTTLTGLDAHSGVGESAAWADINEDGFLDLYIVNWYDETETHPDRQDRLYLNQQGNAFVEASGLLDLSRMSGPGFAAVFVDFDNDNDQDLYVVNDKLFGNVLWRNDGAGCGGWCFTDVSVATGAHRPAYSMGIAVGDYDLDGDHDFYYSSIGETILLQNRLAQGQTAFIDVATSAGVDSSAVSWGNFFADLDNDGLEDLYLATVNSMEPETDRLFLNLGQGQFADVSATSGASNSAFTIGAAYADYDLDGKIDFVVGNRNQGYRLYHNITATQHNWLSVTVSATDRFDRSAAGTKVILTLDDGTTLMRYKQLGASIGSNHQQALHFGLGQRQPVSLEVVWPDGSSASRAVNDFNTTIEQTFSLPPHHFADGFESLCR